MRIGECTGESVVSEEDAFSVVDVLQAECVVLFSLSRYSGTEHGAMRARAVVNEMRGNQREGKNA